MSHRFAGRPLRAAAVTCVLAALAATACATARNERGLAGGYTDRQIDGTRYLVGYESSVVESPFHTDGSRDLVWSFWFHRCAELTLEKGFSYFDLGQVDTSARAESTGSIWVSVTIWRTRGVAAMYAAIPGGRAMFDARRVVERLGPYVQADGAGDPPDRKLLLRGTLVKLGANGAPVRIFTDGMRIGYVDPKRLLVNVAEGRAAILRIQASFARKKAQLDARAAELDRVRKAHDAERDLGARADLDRDLAALRKSFEQAGGALEAERDAAQRDAFRRLSERAAPVIDRVRSRLHLDTVTEEAPEEVLGGVWDVDITDDVSRAYDERYPVPGAS